MRKLGIILVVLVAVVMVLPIRNLVTSAYGGEKLTYTQIQRAVEAMENADESFVNDINRLGLITEALTSAITEGKQVYIEYATLNEYNQKYAEYVSPGGYAMFRLRIRTDATDEYFVDYPTNYRAGFDDYEHYRAYVTNIYRPIKAFIDIYNEYIESDNFFEDVILIIGMIGSAIFAILYLLIVFLFDSLAVLWGIIVCILRIIGLVPIPRT